MKKLALLFTAVLFSVFTFGQLSGNKTIPGDYATVALAIADLNAQGVTAPGVTFTIASGYSETFLTPTAGLITATGTTPNDQIIFQSTTGGTRPVITAAVGTSLTVDGIIVIRGGNYITFDGIDLQESAANVTPTTQMEWGYALVKVDGTNGAQNNTIKNCTITLNKANTVSAGIYFGNHTDLITTALTVTNVTGANSNNKVNGNTVNNVFTPIYILGFNDLIAPYAFYDQNNEIGFTTGNTVYNYGGTTTSYGIYLRNNNNAKISNNNIGNIGTTNTLRGIYLAGCTNANVDVTNNTIALSSAATTSQLTGIESAITGTTNIININNNIIQSCAYATATTGSFYGIYNNAAAFTVNITGNTITNNTIAGTGTFYGIETGSPNTVFVTNNNINNNGRTGIGTIYCIKMTSPANITINGNTIEQNNQNAAASTGSTYGVYGLSSSVNVTVTNNIIRNMSVTGAGSIYGVREFGVAGNKVIQNNQIYGFSSPGGGSFYGVYASTGTIDVSNNQIYALNATGGTAGVAYGVYISGGTTNNIYRNRIYNLSLASAGPVLYGVFISAGTTNNVYNNFISDLQTPSANAANPLAGIYISGGTTDNVYNNTIYLKATSAGALFGSSGIFASVTPSVDLRNNIVVNESTPVGATGYTAAYRRSGPALGTYMNSSNNNDFYAGTPGPNNVIFYDGASSDQTMAAFQTRVTPRDAVSFSQIPPFVNVLTTPYNLHLQTTVPTMCESGAEFIPVVTGDIDGDLRWGEPGYIGTGTARDVGADEFEGMPSFTCAAPAPGNTVASVNPLCFGQSVTLSLQNATSGTGVSYQWQSSTDGITYSNVSGAASSTYLTTPTTAIYYQCIVTCQNGPVSATSVPVQLTFANSVTSTTPGNRCGTGSVVLNAAGSAGTTLNWYNASTGGLAIGTGSPFNTPSISATTTFYVGAEVITIAPGNATIGSGTTTNTGTGYPTAFGNYWYQSWHQMVFTVAELQAAGLTAGNITSVAFNVLTVPSPNTPPADYSISIGTTTNSTLSAWQTTGLTTCFGPAAPPAITVGWNTINLTTPYNWDGVSNIIIDIKGTELYGSANAITYNTATTGNMLLYGYSNTNNPAYWTSSPAATATTARLNVRFGGTTASVCSSPRLPVVATVSSAAPLTVTADQTVCNNSITTLTVTSNLPDYDTYVWSPVTNLYSDAAATTAYVAGTNASTVYFKSATSGPETITCTSNNTTTLCSNVTTTIVTVENVVPIPTSTNNPVSVCQAAVSAQVDATAPSLPVNSTYSFGLNLLSPGPATPFTIVIPALPAGAVVTGTALEIINANSINGSYRSEIRVALSGLTTLAATQISTLGSGGLITPNPSITVPNIPATGGSLTLTLSESYDDGGAGTTDATFGEIRLVVTYTLPLPINWYNASTAGTLLGTGSPFETVGTTVLPNTTTPGTYHFYAQASAGSCVSPSRLDVSVVVNPVLVALTPVNVTCNGGNNGSFTLGTISCGTAPFTFSVDGGAFGAIPTNLTAGTYSVVAKDNGGNSSTPISVVITEPSWTVSAPVAGLPVSVCKDAASAIINVTPSAITNPQTITVPFDVLVQPTEVNAAPGNIIATATLPSLPAGSAITSVVFSYPGLTALGGSWQADVNLGFSGSVSNVAASGTGATNGAGLFTYTRTLPNTSVDLAGGSVNLLYWDAYSDNPGDECTFTTGTSVATLTITYNPGSDINWYTSNVGGTLIGTGASIEAVGTSVLANTATPGTYNFYAEGTSGTCISSTRTLVTVTVNALPTIALTSPAAVSICQGGNTDITLALTGAAPWTWVGNDGSGPATFNATSSPATSNVAPTVNTTYSILSVTDANGCTNTSTESVVVTVNSLPTISLTSPAAVTLCNGENSDITLALTGTGPWTWVGDDGSGPATFNAASSPATANVAPTVNTTYSILSVTDANGCTNTSTESVVVTVNPLPTIALTSPAAVSICMGGNTDITLALTGTAPWTWVGDDGSGPVTFNATSSPFTSNVAPVTNTTYSVISVTDANGCTNTSTEAVVVTVNTLPTLNFGPDQDLCDGSSAILDAGNAGSTYLWSDGSTNQTLTVTVSGTYSVTVTNPNTCTTSDTIVVTFNTPAPVTVTENLGVLSSDAVTGNQWYEQAIGILAGEVNQNYTPTADGNYYVIVTDINGCTVMSNVVSFVLSSSSVSINSGLNIYPNPAKGNVFVEVSNTNNSDMTIELMTMDGRVLYQRTSSVSGTLTMSININDYASGVYMIKAVSENKTMIRKLIVQ